MKITSATDSDWDKIVELHSKQPFDYKLPEKSELVDVQVLVDDNDEIQIILASRKVVELNLIINPNSNMGPLEKWIWIQKIADNVNVSLKKDGYKQVFCWLPNEISKSFGRRMKKLGGKFFTWAVYGWDL